MERDSGKFWDFLILIYSPDPVLLPLASAFVKKEAEHRIRINSETALPFSQSHTAVHACGFKKEFTLLYGQFLTVRCQNCQAKGRSTGSKNPRICQEWFKDRASKLCFFKFLASNENGRCLVKRSAIVNHWDPSPSIFSLTVFPHIRPAGIIFLQGLQMRVLFKG